MAETSVSSNNKLVSFRRQSKRKRSPQREYIRPNEFTGDEEPRSSTVDALGQGEAIDLKPRAKRLMKRGVIKKYSQGGPPEANANARRWEPDHPGWGI